MYGDGFTRRSTRYTASGSTGSTRSKRCDEHDLEDVAVEDVLLRRLDRCRPRLGRDAARHRGQLGELVGAAGARARTAAGGRARRPRHRAGRSRRRTSRRARVTSAPWRRIHVLDEEEALAEVVERGDLARERAHRVGKSEVVARNAGSRSISRTVS